MHIALWIISCSVEILTRLPQNRSTVFPCLAAHKSFTKIVRVAIPDMAEATELVDMFVGELQNSEQKQGQKRGAVFRASVAVHVGVGYLRRNTMEES